MISYIDIVRWILLIVLLAVVFKHSHWSVFASILLVAVILEIHMCKHRSRYHKLDSFIFEQRAEWIKNRLIKAAEDRMKENYIEKKE